MNNKKSRIFFIVITLIIITLSSVKHIPLKSISDTKNYIGYLKSKKNGDQIININSSLYITKNRYYNIIENTHSDKLKKIDIILKNKKFNIKFKILKLEYVGAIYNKNNNKKYYDVIINNDLSKICLKNKDEYIYLSNNSNLSYDELENYFKRLNKYILKIK